MTTGPLIRLVHIERSYPLGKQQFFFVLRDINLEVEEGDFVSVMGPSGAGKSTLVKIISGGLEASGGRVIFEGQERVFASPAEAKAMRKDNAGIIFIAGLVIAAFVSIPIVNLATPLFGMAFMVHMHKRLSGSRRELIEPARVR